MIEVKNIRRHEQLNFEQYKLLPGFSYSWIRSEQDGLSLQIEETPMMMLGKMVDAIIEFMVYKKSDISHYFIHPLYKYAQAIAFEISSKFSHVLPYMKAQISYTATLEHNGFIIPFKGRPDFEIIEDTTLDLKITNSKNITALIEFMQYDRQLYCYGKMNRSKHHYLLIYSIPLAKTFLIKRDVAYCEEWWQEKILTHGTVN